MPWLLLGFLLAGAPANLCPDPGFEAGGEGWSAPPGFTVDRTVAHGGAASLRIDNTDPANYQLASAPIRFRPGLRYAFSLHAKCDNVAGDDSGATICMEWSGPDGWMGGTYPAGIKGTADWTEIRGLTQPIPATATSLRVTCYLRRGMTGTAWFDDVTVTEQYPTPLTGRLIEPGYRGRLLAGEARSVAAEATIADVLPGELALPQVRLRWTLLAGGVERARGTVAPRERIAAVTAELPPLLAGEATFVIELVPHDGGEPLGRVELPLEVRPADAPPARVYVDASGRTIVDGEPFFPLGLYDGLASPQDLQRIADAGFNCVMPYGLLHGSEERARAYLDAAQAAGLKVIASVKDFYDNTHYRPESALGETDAASMTRRAVEAFRGHPALLAWYVNDELPVSYHDVLRERYRQVRRLDPDHPCWAVLYQVGELSDYLDTTDILGTDPYPVGRGPLAMAGDWTRRTREAAGERAAVWQVPQAHDWSNYDADRPAAAPTLEQMRCMTYAMLAEGATGLIYYSFFDLRRDKLGFETRWADMTALAAEVGSLVPFVVQGELLHAAPTEALRGRLFYRSWRRGDEALAVAANGTRDQTLTLPFDAPAERQIRHGTAVELTATQLTLGPEQAVMLRWRDQR